MKPAASPKRLLQGILSGTYSPLHLREFAQLCFTLALPLIHKKIALGKLKLDSVGLKEADVVHDCLADLFRRDEKGDFPQIRTFFDHQIGKLETCSDEEILIELRGLVFGKVKNSLIRIYSEVDPALARILRNLKSALERTRLFDQITRFGEMCLVPRDVDLLLECPPIPHEFLQQELTRVALVHDNVPEMIRKLHGVISRQGQFQRALPLVSTALLFKEILMLGWETEQEVSDFTEEKMDLENIVKMAERVCSKLRADMYSTYVKKGKRTEEEFERYIRAVKTILVNSLLNQETNGRSYFELLSREFPGLTKNSYDRKHRTVLEYLAKLGRERMREEMRKE
jgi:hypothetical protein